MLSFVDRDLASSRDTLIVNVSLESGVGVVRTRFWRKRNAKLDGRLNAVIETTERVRRSIQRPPSRVTIDTSYLDMAAQDYDDAAFSCAEAHCDEQQHFQDADDGSAQAFFGTGDGEAGTREAPAAHTSGISEAPLDLTGFAHEPSDAPKEASSGDASGLEETQAAMLRRVEDAERELEVIYAAAEQLEQAAREAQDLLECETAARQAAEEARDALVRRADDSEIALAILRTQAEAREQHVHAVNGSLERELEARRALEKERDGLAGRVEELEAALGAATANESRLGEANRLLERERTARLTAEAERDDRMARFEACSAELADVRAQLAVQSAALQVAEAAAQRELGVRRSLEAALNDAVRKVEVAQADIAALQEKVEDAHSAAQGAIEKERAALLRRAEEAEQRLLEVEALVGSREAALREAAAEQDRVASACKAAEAERDVWARRTSQSEMEVAALERALAAMQAEPVPMAVPVPTVTYQPAVESQAVAANVASEIRAEDVPQAPAPQRCLVHKSEVEREAPAAEPVHLPVVTSAEPAVQPKGAVTTAGKASARRERRVASQIPATLWREGMGQPLGCTLRDRSSGGARLEFKHASIIEGFSAFNVGDQVTLTLNSAHEKTWVGCEVVWIDSKGCGVRFSGQFRSEGPASRKSARTALAEKAPRAKGGSRLAAVFSLRGS